MPLRALASFWFFSNFVKASAVLVSALTCPWWVFSKSRTTLSTMRWPLAKVPEGVLEYLANACKDWPATWDFSVINLRSLAPPSMLPFWRSLSIIIIDSSRSVPLNSLSWRLRSLSLSAPMFSPSGPKRSAALLRDSAFETLSTFPNALSVSLKSLRSSIPSFVLWRNDLMAVLVIVREV